MREKLIAAAAVLSLLFGMNRCAVACSAERRARAAEEEVEAVTDSLTSRCEILDKENAVLRADTASLRQSVGALQTVNEKLIGRKVNVYVKQ